MKQKLNLSNLNKASLKITSLENEEKRNAKAGDGPPLDIKSLCEDWCSVTGATAAEAIYFM